MAKPAIELLVESLGARGDGIARHGEDRVFLPFTLPGDRVRARLDRAGSEGIAGRVVEILQPGPGRTVPACRHFGDCGGCALQHLEVGFYSEWKTDLLRGALARRGLSDGPMEPMVPGRPATRRRADLTALRLREGVTLGFNARMTHRVADLAECPILLPEIVALLPALRALCSEILAVGGKAELVVAATDGGLDLLVIDAGGLGLKRREALVAFADVHDLARVSHRHPRQGGPELVVERRPVTMRFGGIAVPIPPGAFLQATAEGESALTAVVTEAARDAATVADLYCGCGTFTFPLAATGAAVHAVDGLDWQIRVVDRAARAAVLNRVTAEVRDLSKRALQPAQLAAYDAVVFDPPRAGASAQAEALAESNVRTVIGISCNPASFARDARILVDGGFHFERVLPVDQFLWSPHLELAAVFRR
jgi:23S rRNA (uracil1939-C5)-methyltransferase